jgi:hypothetical protein
MSYVISVGGDPINPNPYTYSQISMTGNIILVWPSNTENATYTATNWIDITSSAAYTVTMPAANEAGEGAEVAFYNYGSFTITINDSASGNITTVASGETKRVWIADNSTAAGSWRIANIGSGTTSADASMLAGYGILAQASLLSQSMPSLSYNTDSTLNAGTRAALVKWTGGAGTFTLTSPATLGSNWFTDINNAGSGILTIDGNGVTIDSHATVDVSIGQGFTIATDGSNFFTSGKNPPVTTSYTLLTKAVGGSTDVTLTSAEAAYSIIYFTGVLTGNINVIVPVAVNEWVMFNNTTGAYTLTVKTPSGSGVAITQATRRILNSDGTNVNYSDAVGTGTVTSISTGTGLSGGPITTSGTVSLANTAVVAGSYGSAGTTATFSVNAQGQLTAAAGTAISIPLSGISDYSSGSWTAAFASGGGGTVTIDPSFNSGRYVKVGQLIFVSGDFRVSSVSSPSGALTITGLPYTAGNNNGNNAAISVTATGLTSSATTSIVGSIAQNGSTITLAQYAAGTSGALAGNVQTSSDFFVSGFYFTN